MPSPSSSKGLVFPFLLTRMGDAAAPDQFRSRPWPYFKEGGKDTHI